MTADVETMAYTGPRPWHGLGYEVDPTLSPDEMIVAAGLDWRVKKEPLFLKDHQHQIHSHFALTRYDRDGKFMSTLGVCGPKYEPVQNRDAFKFFQRFTNAGAMTLQTAGALDFGRKVWCLASINDGFTLPGDDRVEGYILMYHPHIWGKALSIMFTPIRVVCQNTLTMALAQSSGHFRMPHIHDFDDSIIKAAEETLGLSGLLLNGFHERAKFLTTKQFNEETVNRFIAGLFDKKCANEDEFEAADMNRTAYRVKQLIDLQPGHDMKAMRGTWWGAFNAVTYFVDHEAGNNRDTALQSAWFGQRAALKRKALEDALEFAKAA